MAEDKKCLHEDGGRPVAYFDCASSVFYFGDDDESYEKHPIVIMQCFECDAYGYTRGDKVSD